MSGRTIWQAQDCAWWLRERITELGEEFGPAGPAVANWLECQAKLQNAGGLVKTGYRAIARGAFLTGGAEEAERIVRFAVDVGFLHGFEEGTRTFEAVVSAFKADQARGRDTMNKQDKREAEVTAQSEEPPRTRPDKTGQDRTCPVPVGTGEKRREELHPLPPQGGRKRDLAEWETASAEWASRHFPAGDPGMVRTVAGMLVTRRLEPTADAIRDFAMTRPIYAAQLGLNNITAPKEEAA